MPDDRTRSCPSVPETVFPRLGERLCLDFVNTLAHRLTDVPDDLLPNYKSLIDWAWSMEIISEPQLDALLQFAIETPQMADEVFNRALTLRETLYQVFIAIVSHLPPDNANLVYLHALYIEALSHTQLVLRSENFALIMDSTITPELILWAVTRSAIDLLTVDHLSRLKQCPGLNDCGFLFLDTSKNGARFWCSMNFCGSRAKMRRQYARKRQMWEQDIDN